MIVTVLKIYFQEREAKVINYRDYRNFSNEEFRQQVLKDISKMAISFLMNQVFANELLTPGHLRSKYMSDLIIVLL